MLNKKVFIAGHNGMVGSALVRVLQNQQNTELILHSHAHLDLTRQQAVEEFFQAQQIDEVYLAAAKVGGIHANSHFPADFIYQNLMMECNIIQAAHQANVQKLLFLGSSCIYPKLTQQPIPENSLLTGTLEPSNEPYAIAKIAGIKLCESYNRQYGRDYRAVMPTNLYGIHDNFHLNNAHVIPALLNRMHTAKINTDDKVIIWGSGKPRREFLYTDDMAAACVHVMELELKTYQAETLPMQSHINVGTGKDCSIAEVAEIIKHITGFKGRLEFDTSQPDGTPQKLLDVSRLTQLGWQAQTGLTEGLSLTYQWFLENKDNIRT